MHSLHITMPSVFMRMHHVKTSAKAGIKALFCSPPGGGCKPQLIDPPWPAHGHLDKVVGHAGPVVFYRLCKNMDVMPGSQLFNQRY